MPEQLDLLIRNARLRNETADPFQIGIADGRIVAIDKLVKAKARIEIDAGGNLVTESFINPHLHLCKVYTLDMLDEQALKAYHGNDGSMGSAMTSIELAAKVKERYDAKWIIRNVRRAVAHAALYGCTHMRVFADVDNKGRLEGVKALLQARQEFKDLVDLQVVAFAQDGLIREPGAEDLLRQAMQLGADVVGGIPWIEYTDADMRKHVSIIFDIARQFNKPVSMLVDDAGDPSLRTLEMMAIETIRSGWQGRSLAHHGRAAATYPAPYLAKLEHLVKQAGMGWTISPFTGPVFAPLQRLHQAGVLMCLGQDDVSDAYYALGRNNMLECAFLSAHLLWMLTRQEMETLYDMVTVLPARAIGLTDHRLQVGAPANLVVLDQPNISEALRYHQAPAYTISHGKLVDLARVQKVMETSEW